MSKEKEREPATVSAGAGGGSADSDPEPDSPYGAPPTSPPPATPRTGVIPGPPPPKAKAAPSLPALPPAKPKAPTQTADGKKIAPLVLSDTEKVLAAIDAGAWLEKCCESGDFTPITDCYRDKTVKGASADGGAAIKTAVALRVAQWAAEREKYVWMLNAHKFAVSQGAGEQRAIVALASDLKLYRQQMEALEFIDGVCYGRPRKLADLERALNMSEEYGLDALEESQCVLRLRNDMITAFTALENACRGEDFVMVDDAIRLVHDVGADPDILLLKDAAKRRDVLFARDGVARAMLKAMESNSMDALDDAIDQAKAMNFPTTHVVFERATEKLASMRLEAENKEKAAQARRLKSRFGDDATGEMAVKQAALKKARDHDADGKGGGAFADADGASAASSHSAKRNDKLPPKIDPYNPKSGPLPELNIAGYSSTTFTLSAFDGLRIPEDYTKDLYFNKKTAQRGMLLWSADEIPKSLLRPPPLPLSTVASPDVVKAHDKSYNARALKCFKIVQTFMGERQADAARAANLEAYATELMKLGHSDEEMRDEVYSLLIKQTTGNPNAAKCTRGWQLLGLICEAFPPSASFAPFVLHYLYTNSKVSTGTTAPYAPYCMHTLWNTMHEPLKHVTDFTLEHVRRFRARDMRSGDVRVYFLDGSEMNVTVQPWTRVCDSLKEIFTAIKLVDRAGFGIFQVGIADDANTAVSISGSASNTSAAGTTTTTSSSTGGSGASAVGAPKKAPVQGEGRDLWVPLNSCLLDYDPQPRPSVSPVLYRQQASRLVFKRRLYQDLTSEDELAQKLLYYQTLVSICDESLALGGEKPLLRALALHRIIDERLKPTPVGQPNMLATVAVKNILPASAESGYNERKKETLFEKIAKTKAELLSTPNNAAAGGGASPAPVSPQMQNFKFLSLIDEVRELPLFGCVYFNVKFQADDKKMEASLPKGLTMGVSSQGVFLVYGKDKKIHDSWPFYRIVGWDIKDDTLLTVKVRDAKVKNKFTDVRFRSAEAEEIAALITVIMQDIEAVIARG